MARISIFFIVIILISIPFGANAQQPCINTVTVWDNDTIPKIATANGVSASELAALNGLQVNSPLKIGQVLCMDGLVMAQPAANTGGAIAQPAPSTDAVQTTQEGEFSSTTQQEATTTTTDTTTPQIFQRGQAANGLSAGWQTHTVAINETLYGIANQYRVPVDNLAQVNNITNTSLIFAGETLLIPPGGVPIGGGGELTSTDGTVYGPDNPFQPAAGSIPFISLPAQAKPGDSITVTGSNYPGRVRVNLYLEKQSQGLRSNALATVPTRPDGTFTATVTIPTTWPNGSPVNQLTVSVSGYAPGGYWAMNFFVNLGR